MGSESFRDHARKALGRAQVELSSGDDMRVKYAALELRLAIEALTYCTVLGYKDEIPPEEYATWQPRKLMQALLEIEPSADKELLLYVGLEEEYGKGSNDMKYLGRTGVLGMAAIKEHYDALGSYLHVPWLKQAETRAEPSLAALRARCESIMPLVERALSSTLFSFNFGTFTNATCVRCKKEMRKRFPHGKESVDVKCFSCGAPYRISEKEPQSVLWTPVQQKINCPNPECTMPARFWHDEIHAGTFWTCAGCGRSWEFAFGIVPYTESNQGIGDA